MSRENVEIVHRALAAWNGRDIEAMFGQAEVQAALEAVGLGE